MIIIYDEYSIKRTKKYISNTLLYSKCNKLYGFKPKDLGYFDFRNIMMCTFDKNLREVEINE